MVRVRNRFFYAFLSAFLAIAVATPALAAATYGPTGAERNNIRDIARDALISRNIDATAIRDITVDTRVQSSQGGGRVIGFNAWVRIQNCDRGYVVVQMSRRGSVQQVYGYDGCHPAGL